MKIKIDLFQAAIGSILKYGIATLRTTEGMDRKLQQFYSRCPREIVYPNGRNDDERQETNDFIRRKFCMPTFYSQIQTEKSETYRWKKPLHLHT